jgi:hypothetical protein
MVAGNTAKLPNYVAASPDAMKECGGSKLAKRYEG